MRALTPAATALAFAGVSFGAAAAGETRSLTFYNIHTKETATITYKRDGKFDTEGMKQINHMMRDWRRDEPTDMDPDLIDTIWAIYRDVGSEKPIHLVSGYRSAKTNEALRRRGGGQARKSQHVLGKAADIHFPDVDVKRLRNSALVREVGGVGYYPKSGIPFVHVDTGRVRHWPRIPRQELAMIFPDGKTRHVPGDGRPLTRRDGAVAMAKLEKKIDSFIEEKSKIALPPRMVMAGFTPQALKRPQASPEVTGSIPPARQEPRSLSSGRPMAGPAGRGEGPREAPPPLPDDKERATARMMPGPASGPEPAVVRAPAPRPEPRPRVAVATVDDAEHPEELSYGLHSILPLLGDADISDDRYLAQLSAPEPDEAGYLLRDPEGGYSASLAKGLGYTQELGLVTFGAPGREAAQAPAETQAAPVRTASR
jgi:uncharacterized protein YcbK (DUF882 family)